MIARVLEERTAVALADTPAAPKVTRNDIAHRLRQLRAASDEAHRQHQKKIDLASDDARAQGGRALREALRRER